MPRDHSKLKRFTLSSKRRSSSHRNYSPPQSVSNLRKLVSSLGVEVGLLLFLLVCRCLLLSLLCLLFHSQSSIGNKYFHIYGERSEQIYALTQSLTLTHTPKRNKNKKIMLCLYLWKGSLEV